MPRQYIVDPQVHGEVTVGTEGTATRVYLGHLAETGPRRKLYLGGSQEFVTLILGKRGSGKSYTLGAILEGFATTKDETSISKHTERPAVLLLDPMGNFWTTAYPVTSDGAEKVRRQWQSLEGWDCQPEPISVSIWLPAGFKNENDPPGIREFRINLPDMDAADLADLLGLNLIRDPQGAALHEAYSAVTQEGWIGGDNKFHNPTSNYGFSDLIDYVETLRTQGGGDYQLSTLKALLKNLKALERQPTFSGNGTPLTDLLVPGNLSVLMLPLRIGPDLRRVITRLVIRRMLREREQASQIRQRLDIEKLDASTRTRLEQEIRNRIPKSILALDEAQELLGDEGGEARRALEDYCLLGRNYGLSLLLATQRPAATAISSKVRSQVDLYLIHRLLTQEDIDTCWSNLLAVYPDEVREGERKLDFSALVRSLERGQLIVSPSYAKGNDPIRRILIGRVRPRITVHGGEIG